MGTVSHAQFVKYAPASFNEIEETMDKCSAKLFEKVLSE